MSEMPFTVEEQLGMITWWREQFAVEKYIPIRVFEAQLKVRPFVAFELATVCIVDDCLCVLLQRRPDNDANEEFRNRLGLTGTIPMGSKSIDDIFETLSGDGESGIVVTPDDVVNIGTVYGPNKPRGPWTGIVYVHYLGELDELPATSGGQEWWQTAHALISTEMLLSAQIILGHVVTYLETSERFVFDCDESTTDVITD
ncbi:MAG: hypothetical protein COT91_04600 [Candidatus Doudnabacteria bacterium CG10_big_fil_rev_8_21_14_0_10_41_10]|uniref:Nudix hydrolase domain-containing protein n=1 Tax=Candidatus Doudnabacteria bacterium CG10_big_fil_rev_8_21_14_0_10_41_10 TaxID=1974551 RepID=A0A2H0VCK4_9BACT|nr:MAG: hypothetical protein COT91_04600 [Candidatus Doudnabacteria bacterium CG10_big_fil_rev_8_21_14_0_10_41_10]